MTSGLSTGRWLAVVSLTLGVWTALGLTPAQPARAQGGARVGEVRVVDAERRTRTLGDGDHDTRFSLKLPEGATCPGDSANDDWRIQSFVVPASDDPGTLQYMVVGPDGPDPLADARVALYTDGRSPFVDELLGANTEPGRPGTIPDLPAFSFARLPVDFLPSGRYRMGIACTYFGETAQYWDTAVTITTSPDALTWRVEASGAAPTASSAGGSPVAAAIAVAAIAVAVLIVGVLLVRRRTGSRLPLVEENR